MKDLLINNGQVTKPANISLGEYKNYKLKLSELKDTLNYLYGETGLEQIGSSWENVMRVYERIRQFRVTDNLMYTVGEYDVYIK